STSLFTHSGGTQTGISSLKMTGVIPGTSVSLLMVDGNVRFYENSWVQVFRYRQDGGTLSFMGQASRKTNYQFDGTSAIPNAEINGGSVVLSAGSTFHETLVVSNMSKCSRCWRSPTTSGRKSMHSGG